MKDDLLILGGHAGEGGGGIKTIVLEMEQRLSEDYNVRTYDQTAYYKNVFVVKVLLTLWKLFRFPLQNRPDIAHINTTSGFGFYRDSLYILIISLLWRCPVVIRTGGSGFDEFITTDSAVKRLYFQFVFSRVSAILVLTELQRRAIKTHVSDSKVHLFRQATEVRNFSPIWEHEKPHILFLSGLTERKGFPMFADVIERILTISEVQDSDIRISIAGDGKYRKVAQSLDQSHACVTYHGYVTGENKYRLYNEASIFVLPTQAEGFPNVIIEAMAAGNAIISTTASGIPEIVEEENGIVVEPNDPEKLYNSHIQLIQAPEQVERMGRKNTDLVQNKYSWTEAATQLRNIYSNSLQQK